MVFLIMEQHYVNNAHNNAKDVLKLMFAKLVNLLVNIENLNQVVNVRKVFNFIINIL